MWYAGILHNIKLELVLVQLIQHYPVLRLSTSYELKYISFGYYTHCDHINYVWEDRCLGPHNSIHKWLKEEIIKHETA